MNPCNLVILTGSGRSGTTFMTRILRETYGIGMSAEPKEVLSLCKIFSEYDLTNNESFNNAVDIIIKSPVFHHLITVKNRDVKRIDLLPFIEQKSVEGIILGMFKYVAHLRGVDFPGYKDPADVTRMTEIIEYLPNCCFINMVRRGQDVAVSVVNRPWGATNVVAAAFEWNKIMTKALFDKEKLNDKNYLELKLEDLSEDFDTYCKRLDTFITKTIGRSNLSLLKEKLLEYSKPVQSYTTTGLKQKLVNYITSDTYKKLGYPTDNILKKNRFKETLVLFYRIIDIPFRFINLIKRKI